MDSGAYGVDIEQQIEIARPMPAVFDGILREFSEGMKYEDGRSMNVKIEARPGGRWYRDLGNDTGHLWGIVQVIKPPSILELAGPMFMSYPALNHIEVRLSEANGKTVVKLHHRAIAHVDAETSKNMAEGWRQMLDEIKKDTES